MDKDDAKGLTSDVLIADALLQLRALEKILIDKGIFTQEEFSKEMEVITKQITKSILQKANVQGDLDEIISSLNKKSDN